MGYVRSALLVAGVAATVVWLAGCGGEGEAGEGGDGHGVPHLTSAEDFEQKVRQAEGPVLVDFYMDGCPPCKRLAPTIAKLHEEYAGRAAVYKVHNRKGREIVRQFGIEGYPTAILFYQGREAGRWVGAHPESAYRGALDAILQ